jgi:hypothetical protein
VQWLDRAQVDAWAKGNASEPAVTFITIGPGGEATVLARTGSVFGAMPRSADDD